MINDHQLMLFVWHDQQPPINTVCLCDMIKDQQFSFYENQVI